MSGLLFYSIVHSWICGSNIKPLYVTTQNLLHLDMHRSQNPVTQKHHQQAIAAGIKQRSNIKTLKHRLYQSLTHKLQKYRWQNRNTMIANKYSILCKRKQYSYVHEPLLGLVFHATFTHL